MPEAKALRAPSGETLLHVGALDRRALARGQQLASYTILIIEQGAGVFHVDAGAHAFTAPAVLFATPLQVLRCDVRALRGTAIRFHGDFYCIEFHKHEVACNGVLFNNGYDAPLITPTAEQLVELVRVSSDLLRELESAAPSAAVLTAYLQLFLARASHIKREMCPSVPRDPVMDAFRALLERHVRDNLKARDYATRLHMTQGALTRRCRRVFGKTATALINERTILEAKKLLHLTRAPIKEIAFTVGFADEHYFSRFFKKLTRVSPQQFRAQVGISIVADLSTQQPGSSMG